MPALTLIKPLGQTAFFAHQFKLPVDFKPARGFPNVDHYPQAFQERDLGVSPQLMPPWFLPAEPGNKYYQETCDKIGKEFKDFHDTMLDAVVFAHDMWRLQAMFKSIQVMAVSAIGTPGCLFGPELEPLIKTAPACAAFTGHKAKHRDAVAKGVSKCFKDWQDQVTVPGLPWYPAFAAFPGPMAPPTPNVPTPLIACVSAMVTSIVAPMPMKQAMCDALDSELKDKDTDKHFEALYEAIATVLTMAFTTWLPAQQVMNVLGTGPIPTFAPPFVPCGPVVGGSVIPAPGVLAA